MSIGLLLGTFLCAATGGFVGATSGKFVLFVVRLGTRLGWDGLSRVFGKVTK